MSQVIRITVSVTPEQLKALDAITAREDRSRSWVTTQAIVEYLANDLKLHATKVKRSKVLSDVEQIEFFKNNDK